MAARVDLISLGVVLLVAVIVVVVMTHAPTNRYHSPQPPPPPIPIPCLDECNKDFSQTCYTCLSDVKKFVENPAPVEFMTNFGVETTECPTDNFPDPSTSTPCVFGKKWGDYQAAAVVECRLKDRLCALVGGGSGPGGVGKAMSMCVDFPGWKPGEEGWATSQCTIGTAYEGSCPKGFYVWKPSGTGCCPNLPPSAL